MYDSSTGVVHEFHWAEVSAGPALGIYYSEELGLIDFGADPLVLSQVKGFGFGLDGGVQIGTLGMQNNMGTNAWLDYFKGGHNLTPYSFSVGIYAGGGLTFSYSWYITSYNLENAPVTARAAFCRAGC